MTAILAAALAASLALVGLTQYANLRLRDTAQGLRGQIREESRVAVYWHDAYLELLATRHGVTPSWVGDRIRLDEPRAAEPVWFGPVEAAKRGISLPGAPAPTTGTVTPLRPEGGAK